MQADWIKDSGHWFTPGGDPVWVCNNCGCGRHVYGIENNHPLHTCPQCGCEMQYPWENENERIDD